MTDLSFIENRILYEDNHIIIVNKLPGEIVQGDKTGDITLAEDIKDYLKQKYNKPGNVYLGLPHRLDRPTSGAVMYAKTDKALTRLNDMFREGKVEKHYWAITDNPVTVAGGTIKEGELHHWLFRDSTKNKSFAYVYKEQQGPPKKGCQEARLLFKEIAVSNRYHLLDIVLLTGRHHQIRAQLASCGVHIKGDLKYGSPRSNPDGGICLHSKSLSFIHPVSKEEIKIEAPVPEDNLWLFFENEVKVEY